MNILVNQINMNTNDNKSLIKSKEVICPKCGENAKIKINGYKITLCKCKNNHNVNNIFLDEFENLQYMDLSKIICDKCQVNNKNDTFNNAFFWCISCKINLCPLCKDSHDKNHNIIDYDNKNYICKIHNDSNNSYCKDCKSNICILCESLHENHNIIYFGKIIPNINKLKTNLIELRKHIDKLNDIIKNIIIKLNIVKNNYENYYKITNDIINNIITNIDFKKRNYETLSNIEGININYYIKDIENIINEGSINSKLNYIFDIYNKMTIKEENIDEIKIIYKNNKEEKIRIFGKNFVKNNKDICKLLIKGKEYELIEFINGKNNNNEFIEIILKGIKNITDMSCMFAGCSTLFSLSDISKMNTENIISMKKLFYDCISLQSLPDISKWDIENVKSFFGLFQGCSSLVSLPDVSYWDTSNVTDMRCMFYGCSSLSFLPDISKWNINNVTDMDCIFDGCQKLKEIPQKFII